MHGIPHTDYRYYGQAAARGKYACTNCGEEHELTGQDERLPRCVACGATEWAVVPDHPEPEKVVGGG